MMTLVDGIHPMSQICIACSIMLVPSKVSSNVTTMEVMFCLARAFNGDLSGWDTSNITTMHVMFFECPIFVQNKPPHVVQC